jgi:squalene-hopene/tetraprenyl-beta-curcumene cyclase
MVGMMRKARFYLLLVLIGVGSMGCTVAKADVAETKPTVKGAIDRGLRWLRDHQLEDGSWDHYPGITALALTAFARSPRKYREEDGPFIRKAAQFLIACQTENGAFAPPDQELPAYNTSVCIMALTSLENPDYEPFIRKGADYLVQLQADEGEGYESGDKFYGGIGYGSDLRPDLSNLQLSLEALKAADLPENHPVWTKAICFLERCQNLATYNDQPNVGNDGGFFYYPGQSYAGITPEGGLRSYGTMTYAGLKSYIYANLEVDDPRVQAALDWVKAHYTLDENPGLGNAGLFYYYVVFARTFSVLGMASIEDASGMEHDWYRELSEQLLSIQKPEGYWVNDNPRWWEGSPSLCTAYAIIALSEEHDRG